MPYLKKKKGDPATKPQKALIKQGRKALKGKKAPKSEADQIAREKITAGAGKITSGSRSSRGLGIMHEGSSVPSQRNRAAAQEAIRQEALATKQGQRLVKKEQRMIARHKKKTGTTIQPMFSSQSKFKSETPDTNKSTFNNNDESRMMSRGNFGNRS
jgi:hypothetical protein|tara:strand:- start:55 stop:525 length:471 start_codon:yes stop_codon:yes gene_type:complete